MVVALGLAGLVLSGCSVGSVSKAVHQGGSLGVLSQAQDTLAQSMVRVAAAVDYSVALLHGGPVSLAQLQQATGSGVVGVRVAGASSGVLAGTGGVVRYEVSVAGSRYQYCVSFSAGEKTAPVLEGRC